MNMCASIRLGFTAFLLSYRLSPSAVKDLMKSTRQGCYVVFYAIDHSPVQLDATADDLEVQRILIRNEYDDLQHEKSPDFHRANVNNTKERF